MSKTIGKSIFVVEAGFVFLCDSAVNASEQWVLENASVIRQWGTTKGLGQIALQGPTKETILDPCGSPCIPESKVLFILPCTY